MSADALKDGSSTSNPFPIVAIGASAGGLNSIQCFLNALPKDFGFAIVFLQHLSHKHGNLLPGLLRSGRPELDIREISDGMEVLPGKLYLCPPETELGIEKNILHMAPLSGGHIHLPIDEFFTSLAEDAGERAIAVIFSGAGTDGARGVREIKNEGGTVFVQDPATAEFPGMPFAAIDTGKADSVLQPEGIASEILRLCGAVSVRPEGVITGEDFETFYKLILEKTGYRFNYYKKNVVNRRIRRRMYLRGVFSVPDYIKMVAEKDAEAGALAADLMIGVTSFFRDRLAWKALKLDVIRRLAAEENDFPVRVWTPACATGEEAYSIAMMLHHEFELAGKKREIQVFATDVNDRMLDKAREGKYPGSIVADVPPEYMKRYFTCSEDGLSVIIGKEIRERVVVAKQDLLTDPPFSRLDLIICRNLLIYLEPQAQEKCISLFHYALKEGGYLFLGNAESVGRSSSLFKSLPHKKCRVYKKLETTPSSRLPLPVPFASERAALPPIRASVMEQQSVTGYIQESLLEEYAPAAVAINQHYDIIYHNGPTNRYLRQPRGAPTQNLLELLSENLRSRVRGAIYRTTQEAKPVSIRAGIPGDDERKIQVTLRISRLKEDLSLIVFHEKGGIPEQEAEAIEAAAVGDHAIRQLESELSATRADLQSHIEQLKSLNEELQSSNEELQAANEELETSREELQSLNEELTTVNSQLQGKIEEQDETNNDLNNFLASTNIPTVFLDQRFRVKRFTPAMSKLLKLIPSDAGRPIADMSLENLGPELIADAQTVLDNLVPVKKEVLLKDIWYVRTALPYRTSDNRIEGVIITYSDVTEIKAAEERTRHLASFPQLNPNPVLEVDSSGKVIFFNPATQKILESLGMDRGDFSVFLPKDMEGILKDLENKTEATLYREINLKDRSFGESIYLSPRFNVARIYTYDITERKLAAEASRKLAAVLRDSNDAIMVHDFEGNITVWNHGAERLFGWTEAEALKMKIRDTIPAEKLAEALAYLERLYLGEPVSPFETQRLTKDGRALDIWQTATVLVDEAGKPVAIATTERDITERKSAAEEINRAKEEWERTFASVPDMIAILDNEHRIIRVNESMAKRLGRRPEECVGMRCYEAVHGTTAPPDFCPHSRTIKDGREHVQEIHEERLGMDLLVTTTPLFDEQGKMIASVHVAHDITGRKQAEEKLRESEERYRSIFEGANDGIIACDITTGKFLFVNERMSALTGYSEQEMLRLGIKDLHRQEDLPYVLEQFNKQVAGEITKTTAIPVLRKDKGIIYCDISSSFLGKTTLIGFFRDVTERKQAEEKLERLLEELKRSNKELEQFAYIASHDLQEPLRMVTSYLELLDKRYRSMLDKDAGEFIDYMARGAAHMKALLNDLLEYSRVGTKGKPFELTDLNISLKNAIANLKNTIEGSGAQITSGNLPGLYADETQMVQLFQNLIGNAIKFRGSEAPLIKISSELKGNEWVVKVSDNGIGIAPKFFDKIFLIFQRLHVKEKYPGTGIGLSICKKIVERHSGRIWVESELGKGAAFCFTLPMKDRREAIV